MKTFKFENKQLEFSGVSGDVIDQQKYSETHVSSSGGGGYVGPHGGHVSAPSIHSTAVTKQEFWLKADDGGEKAIQLSGVDVAIRTGQKITLISAKRVDKNDSYPIALINHTTNDNSLLENGKSLNAKSGLLISWGRSLLIAFSWWCTVGAVGLLLSPKFSWLLNFSWISATVVFVISYFLKASRIRELEKLLSEHIESLVKTAAGK
jgi:hypothetical protein